MARSIVYVDGFNLYYGLYKNRKHRLPQRLKWLDLGRYCALAFPSDQVDRIRYFTADVSASVSDPDQPIRQQAFLKALSIAVPQLQVHKGKFQPVTRKGFPVDPSLGSAQIEIRTFEEKGSDVNIASYVLLDAFRRGCEKAVVISNDSDLAEPLRIVRDELGIEVVVHSPYPWVTNDLKAASSTHGVFDAKLVKHCQMPDKLMDHGGTQIVRPQKWS